jgi:hypothetical protein
MINILKHGCIFEYYENTFSLLKLGDFIRESEFPLRFCEKFSRTFLRKFRLKHFAKTKTGFRENFREKKKAKTCVRTLASEWAMRASP